MNIKYDHCGREADMTIRYRHCEASGIRKAVSEEKAIKDWEEKITDVADSMRDTIWKRFKASRRLTAPELTRIHNDMEQISRNPSLIWSDTSVTKKSRNNEERELRTLHCSLNEWNKSDGRETFRLFCTSMKASKRRASIDLVCLPSQFRLHALERLVERFDGESEAIKSIGETLWLWSPAVHALKNYAETCTGGYLMIPAKDRSGLLCGQFSASDDVLIRETFNERSHQRNRHDLSSYMAYKYTVNTFVSFNLLKTRQMKVMQFMSDWMEANIVANALAAVDFFSPSQWICKDEVNHSVSIPAEIVNELASDADFNIVQKYRHEQLTRIEGEPLNGAKK